MPPTHSLIHSFTEYFPALAQTPNGKRLAFLDSAASAQKPAAVLQSLQQTLAGAYANIHRGLYHNSAVTTQAFEDARHTIAAFLKADAKGLIFTRNSTEAINLVAQTWGRQNLTAKSVVTVTELEHHANIVPWQLLQAEIGFQIRVIPYQHLLSSNPQILQPYLEGCTLLALTQMSNVTGFQPDLKTILPLAKQAGATIVVDGSQGAVHGPQNLSELGADFYTFTGHKLYGPTGIGVLWGRPQLLETLPPYQGGGDMIETVKLPTGTTFAGIPARFEAGTPAIAEAIALAAAITFIEGLGWEAIQQHESKMAQRLSATIGRLPYVEVYGPHNTGIVAFNLKGAHATDVATLLDQQGVAVRSGHHCAMPLMEVFGTPATVRASIGLYTTEDDIEQLSQALQKTWQMLK